MITLLLIVITILLIGFFAGIETGCYTLSRLKLLYRKKKNRKGAAALYKLVNEPQKFVFMTLICQNVFVDVTSMQVTDLYLKSGFVGENITYLLNFFPWSAEVAATLTLIFPLFIFAEVGPKNLFLSYSDVLMYKTVRFQQLCFIVCKPLVYILKLIADLMPSTHESGYYNFDEMNVHKLKLFFIESQKDGIINSHQNNMINNLIKLQEVNVSNIMIPTNKLFALPVDGSSEVLQKELKKRKNNYSDIPIYSKNKKRIIGTIEFFDVIEAIERNKCDLKKDVKKIIRLRSNLNIHQAFHKMQQSNESKALIIDRKRTVLGVIYLKDIISYITRKGISNEVHQGKIDKTS